MAITSIGALIGLGSNQSATQALGQPPQPANEAANIGSAATPQDQFTPSALNSQQNTSQAAGLFTVSHLAPFTAAADAFLAAAPAVLTNQETAALNVNPATGVVANNDLFAQPAALQGNAAAPTVTVPPTVAPNTFLAQPTALQGNPAAPNVTVGPKDVTRATILAANQAAPAVANANAAPLAAPAVGGANATAEQAGGAATQPGAAAVGTANGAATGTASIVEQLQALNNALQALGLSPADIQQLDRIASVIKDFNPAAFTSLAYQLAALAPSATTQQAPANAAASATGGQTTAGTAALGRP